MTILDLVLARAFQKFSLKLRTSNAINPIALLCIGDVIAILMQAKFAILTLATLVIFFSLLIKLFFKAKAAKTALLNLVPNKIW